MDGQAVKKVEPRSNNSTSHDPHNGAFSELNSRQNNGVDCRKFEVLCHAGNAGHLEVASDSVSVRIGQRICKDGKEELWSSLLVECKAQEDGSLAIEAIVFHPGWDEPLRIACIRSSPLDRNSAETLQCDFEQKPV